MGEFNQRGFIGGMNAILEDNYLPEDTYAFLQNGRIRYGGVVPNKKAVLVSEVPSGKKQGLVAAGSTLICFVSGFAYYRLDGQTTWNIIPGFAMDPLVERYETALVPASNMNYKRTSGGSVQEDASVNNVLTSSTPQALVVQDGGYTQPHVIFPNGTARACYTYADWSNTTNGIREYVPKGRQMLYFNGILYIVSTDGTKIYRSVTGRPLDFMVNIDPSGNKLANEAEGGAVSTSHSVGYEEITCLAPLNAEVFMVGTRREVVLVQPIRDITIFGEPTFANVARLQAGVVNSQSVIEVTGTGDTAFIDFEGIKSFNAVLQLKNEGNNSNFSLPVSPYFRGIVQDTDLVAATDFDDYSLFSVSTSSGFGILVFDNLLQKWVAFDQPFTGAVKQFATTYTSNEQKLYAITSSDEVYRLYDSTNDYERVTLRTRAVSPSSLRSEHKPIFARCVLTRGVEAGTLEVIPYVDGKRYNSRSKTLRSSLGGVSFPVIPPVGPDSTDQVDLISLNFPTLPLGWKFSNTLRWDNGATLTHLSWETEENPSLNSPQQKALSYT